MKTRSRRKKKPEDKKLTYLQQKFVEHYQGRGKEAAEKAGFRGNSDYLAMYASVLLTKPHIQKAIRDRDKRARRGRLRSRQEILNAFMEIAQDERAMNHDKLRALEQISKIQGFYIKRVAVASHQTVQYSNLDRLSDKEVVERMNTSLASMGITQRVKLDPTGTIVRDMEFD